MAYQSFRELEVWQVAMALVGDVYSLTNQLPKHELYGVTSQIRRSAVSIPSNISEGSYRKNPGEYKQFCAIAYASAAELETQLLIIGNIYNINCNSTLEQLTRVQKMLNRMIIRLSPKTKTEKPKTF